jgi:hypothetical protein
MAKQYSIVITNKARHPGYFMLFQSDPAAWSNNAMALAWLSRYATPGTSVRLAWNVEYGVSWADTGVLEEGVLYVASENHALAADANQVTLDHRAGFLFTEPARGPQPDRLYLRESADIPVNSTAAVGITMAGSTVYAVQARPNQQLEFAPRPSYFLAYGDYEEGTVIDIGRIGNAQEIDFPANTFSLATTLRADGSWTPPVSLAVANAERMKLRAL